MKRLEIFATLPPYVDHRLAIINHPLVSQLRFNTVMPIGEKKLFVLRRLLAEVGSKKLWLDLKTRQLRITEYAYLPYAYVRLSHKIKVNLPCEILFKDGRSKVVEIHEGNKLILGQRPARVVGSGEPVNILHPSLEIQGFLTKNDLEYIAAAKKLGLHNYMLSFFEKAADLEELLRHDPDAQVIAKIESLRGLNFVSRSFNKMNKDFRLMAARDDLLINLGENRSAIMSSLKKIIKADPEALVASRLLTSLEEEAQVSMGDLSDFTLMRQMGFKSFMLSDMLCFHGEAFFRAMGVLSRLLEAKGK